MKPTKPMRNLLTAIEQANKLAQSFGLQFFAYVSEGEQKENLSSNLVLSDLETVIGGLREWQTGTIPEPTGLAVLILEAKPDSDFKHGVVRSLPYVGRYRWQGGIVDHPNKIIKIDCYTGRWFIQPINLPCSDPTN